MDFNTDRPRNIAPRYWNDNPATGGSFSFTYEPTSLTTYTQADVAQMQLVQETQSAEARIYSSVALDSNNKGIYHLDLDMTYTGRNNGTAQIVRLSLADLPGWPAFAQASTYVNRICFATNGAQVTGETVSFVTPTLVQFEMENSGSARILHWELTFIQ